MKLYTIILEVGGGTYLAQSKGEGPQHALLTWAAQEARRLGDDDLSRAAIAITEQYDPTDVVAVDGLAGVWCFTGLLGKNLILSHVVLSASRSE